MTYRVEAAHQGLKGIHAQPGRPEHADADAADQHAQGAHADPENLGSFQSKSPFLSGTFRLVERNRTIPEGDGPIDVMS